MSKKRVHELGKMLKDHGIELSNQELVEKLHQLGYDVKSHSSSLEEDQAQAAVDRIVGERKPKAVAPKAAGPGFVVRKRAAVPEVAHPAPPPPAPPPPEEYAAQETEALEHETAFEAAPPAPEPEVPAAAATAEPSSPAAPAAPSGRGACSCRPTTPPIR